MLCPPPAFLLLPSKRDARELMSHDESHLFSPEMLTEQRGARTHAHKWKTHKFSHVHKFYVVSVERWCVNRSVCVEREGKEGGACRKERTRRWRRREGGVMHYDRATDKGGGAVAMATGVASGVFIHSGPHVLAYVHIAESNTEVKEASQHDAKNIKYKTRGNKTWRPESGKKIWKYTASYTDI